MDEKLIFILLLVAFFLDLGLYDFLSEAFTTHVINKSRKKGIKFPDAERTVKRVVEGIENIRYKIVYSKAPFVFAAYLHINEDNREGRETVYGKIHLPECSKHSSNDLVSLGTLHEGLHLKLAAQKSIFSHLRFFSSFLLVEVVGCLVLGVLFFFGGGIQHLIEMAEASLPVDVLRYLLTHESILFLCFLLVFLVLIFLFHEFSMSLFKLWEETAVFVGSLKYGKNLYGKAAQRVNFLVQATSYFSYVLSFVRNLILFVCAVFLLFFA